MQDTVSAGVKVYRDVCLQYVVAFWQYYSDLCWWSDSCLVFQGAKGPDGPAGEIGLEGKKVRTLGYTFIKSRRHNSEKKHIREQNC